jgi:hypothetical protein
MNNYPEFKREYVARLTEMLSEPKSDGVLIGTRRSRRLANELADLEELHPNWTMLVEDWLAERHLLQ